jgi:hypothetical protein
VQSLNAAVGGTDATALTLPDISAGEPMAPPFTPVVSRGLALAALAALGEGGEANDANLQRLLDENSAAFCLNLAKLNLYQCLSVAKPYYEDVFCLGQHILLDTAQCVQKGAGGPPFILATLTKPPPATPAARPASSAPARAARPAPRPARRSAPR